MTKADVVKALTAESGLHFKGGWPMALLWLDRACAACSYSWELTRRSGKYLDGHRNIHQDPPSYEITVGMVGSRDPFPTIDAAVHEGLLCLYERLRQDGEIEDA